MNLLNPEKLVDWLDTHTRYGTVTPGAPCQRIYGPFRRTVDNILGRSITEYSCIDLFLDVEGNWREDPELLVSIGRINIERGEDHMHIKLSDPYEVIDLALWKPLSFREEELYPCKVRVEADTRGIFRQNFSRRGPIYVATDTADSLDTLLPTACFVR